MIKILPISKKELFNKLNITEIDLLKEGFFSAEDLRSFTSLSSSLNQQIRKMFLYRVFLLKNPGFIYSFIAPLFISKFSPSSGGPTLSLDFIEDYNLKVSIASAFDPDSLLEIGTYLGWGAAAFKFVLPKCEIYTMNPKVDKKSNNPIHSELVGQVYRTKNLDINQIWADSTRYDYTKLPNIDVAYIDGNHEYDFVFSDLRNVSKLQTKCILVDDYIPPKNRFDHRLTFAPWNESVVKATNRFLRESETAKEAYWIENSKLAVLLSDNFN